MDQFTHVQFGITRGGLARIAMAAAFLLSATTPVAAQTATITPVHEPARPVTVVEKVVSHSMQTAPYAGDDTMYPSRGPAKEIKAVRDQIKARVKELDEAYEKTNAELVKRAREAQQMWSKMSETERQSAAARKMHELMEAVRTAMVANRDSDQKLQQLIAQYEQLRNSVYEEIDHAFPLITLSNGLIEVKIAPTLGMRVVNAVDLQTGRSLSGTPDPRYYEKEPFKDAIGWNAGYVEPSFPYFEHGVGVRQPAGYRIIRYMDGSATVAMNMRFTDHQHPRHMARYGRYNQRSLSGWVTLHPGERGYELVYRLDNPNPLRRGDRLWVNFLMDAERYDAKHIIYPAGYVMPHGAGKVWAFAAPGGNQTFQNVSHFALYTDYRFRGVYSDEHDFNSLIITDPSAPGMKLYTRRAESGFLEHWTGHGVVFEDAGGFVMGYEPVEVAHYCYGVGGIGRIQFANEHVAISYEDDGFVIASPREARVTVTATWDGQRVGTEGRVQPGKPITLKAPFECELTVRQGDEVLARVDFPLQYTDTTARLAEAKPLGGKTRIEKEQICNHVGAPTSRDAVREARKLVRTGEKVDHEYGVSIARTAYRWGHFDLALQLLDLAGGGPDADFLRGLIAWEKGGEVDFGSSGVEANYHRALLVLQVNEEKKVRDFAAALRYLNELIDKRPKVYRPRLMRAYLMKDMVEARRLAKENPGSPEALLVLELIGDAKAVVAKRELLRNNPGAAEQVEAFKKELTEGQWTHVRRYAPMLPDPE